MPYNVALGFGLLGTLAPGSHHYIFSDLAAPPTNNGRAYSPVILSKRTDSRGIKVPIDVLFGIRVLGTYLRHTNASRKAPCGTILGEGLEKTSLRFDGRLSKPPFRHPREPSLMVLDQRHVVPVRNEIRVQFANVKLPPDLLGLA